MSTSHLLLNGHSSGYSPLCVIGISDHGVALKAIEKSSGSEVAIKVLWNLGDVKALREVVKEIRVMSKARHPNLMSLRDVYIASPHELHLVTDIMETTLQSLIRTSPPCTAIQTQVIMYQVLEALCYLNSAGLCHAGVSLASVLINTNCDVRLVDFQGVVQHGQPLVPCRWVDRRLPPELWHGWDVASPAIDIWQAGMVFAQLLTWAEIGSAVRPDILIPAIHRNLSSEPTDEAATDLLRNLLREDSRISLQEALQHRYFDSLEIAPSQEMRNVGRIEVESVERASGEELSLELQLHYSN